MTAPRMSRLAAVDPDLLAMSLTELDNAARLGERARTVLDALATHPTACPRSGKTD